MFGIEDIKNFKMFKHIINAGRYDLKGDAVFRAAILKKWFEDLEDRIQSDIDNRAKEKIKLKEKPKRSRPTKKPIEVKE